MTQRHAPAALPPTTLPGLEPSWSRLVRARDGAGEVSTWHVLDRPATAAERGTLLCVHGNPTWSYTWRKLVAAAPAGWRVVAPDQLEMGFSERTGTRRILPRRITDLGALTEALAITGPVVLVAHDWGGPIGLGWALAHREQLAGVVLTNTAVHQPEGSPAPAVIRLARLPGVLPAVTQRTPTFLNGTLSLSRPPLDPDVRAAYLAPYGSAMRREAIRTFVEDIPLTSTHPSWQALIGVRDGLAALADVPALLLWGPDDPVFGDRYLADLRARLPQAAVHRFEGASHLVGEDADVPGAVVAWLGDATGPAAPSAQVGTTPSQSTAPAPTPGGEDRPLWSALEARAEDHAPAIVEMGDHGGSPGRTLSWVDLHGAVHDLAAGLAALGVRRGDRVGLLIPPGADLATVVYACWRVGAVIVIADAGLGVRGLHRAVRGARPDLVIGIARAMRAAKVLGWPGRRVVVGALGTLERRAYGVEATLDEVALWGAGGALPPPPPADADAAILFTSVATGAAKGVVYRHRQLQAQRKALATTYGIGPGDRLVAAFAPFALYGPALGIASVVPDMDVTAPRTLTAAALADAADAVGATLVFASPAALEHVHATADALDKDQASALARVRLLLSAGAPIPAALLRRMATLLPEASAHTPYGMTEALPVADISLADIEEAGAGPGVCVGKPVAGVEIALRALTADGTPEGPLTIQPGITGEISVRAAHVKDRYDHLWLTERASSEDTGWHRTGDVGQLDEQGRLWVEGRLAHIIVAAHGVVTPVALEQRVETLSEVTRAAAVGVGPVGTQQVVLVVETAASPRRLEVAPLPLADAVRAAARGADGSDAPSPDVAAVLVSPGLPVDIRHNAKIDRAALAREASALLAGRGGR